MFQLTQSYRELRDNVREWARNLSRDRSIEDMGFHECTSVLYDGGWYDWMFARDERDMFIREVDVLALSLIRESLTRVDCGLDVPFVIQGLGGYPILFFGSDALKQRFLPSIHRGELVPSLCLTEPDAGSDLGGLQATAERRGDVYVLNGTKKFISAGTVADLFVVFAKTDPEQRKQGLSAFLVDSDSPGISVAKQDVMSPHDLARLEFKQCEVPASRRLGEEGQGFEIALKNLEIFRTTVGGMAVGLAQAALDCTMDRVHEREMFGKKLQDFQATRFKLADMATNLHASRLMVYEAAATQNRGEDARRPSSMAKLFATEKAFEIANEAVQLFGGDGVSRELRIGTLFLESRLARIYEGSSEIQRLVIARDLINSRSSGEGESAGD